MISVLDQPGHDLHLLRDTLARFLELRDALTFRRHHFGRRAGFVTSAPVRPKPVSCREEADEIAVIFDKT